MLQLQIAQLKDARAVGAIGGGTLIADTHDGLVVVGRYTAALTPIFNFAAELLAALAKREELPVLSERDLPRNCPTCGNPLSEGTQICHLCVKKSQAAVRMLRYAKLYRLQLVSAALLLILTTLVELIPPYLTKVLIDDVLQTKDMRPTLIFVVAGLGATMLVMTVMQTVRGYIGMWVGSKLMRDIRKEIFGSLMRLPRAYFDRSQTSQFISRVTQDAEAMRQFMTDGVVFVCGHTLRIAAIFIIMCGLDWKLSLIALLPVPIIVAFSMSIWPRIGRLMYQKWRAIFRVNILVGESLQGIRVVKAFGREQEEMSRYEEANADVKKNIKTEGLRQIIHPLFSLIAGLGTLLICIRRRQGAA
ncbi:ABC-type multidrug transport system fused ATPase/permease subunit [Paenibacillus mucilaginosus]